MSDIPGLAPTPLTQPKVRILRADERVFEEMLSGWRAQMLARGLTTHLITARSSIIRRFCDFAEDYPWKWTPDDHDYFMTRLREPTDEKPRGFALSTLRNYSSAIAMFCDYISDPRYRWVELCEREFETIPQQIRFESNTPTHTSDDAVPPFQRKFTLPELQSIFDAVDDFVNMEFAQGSKRWKAALRDSTAFKVAYAFGLRRTEVAMLDVSDFGPNPYMPEFGQFGSVLVRFAKGTKGSGPRRRTVLTTPLFDWVVPVLEEWTGPNGGRRFFPTSARSDAMWPSERADRVSPDTLGAHFTAFRDLAKVEGRRALHSLRHSHTTELIETGYDSTFVQRQLGHQNASTTALYTGVSPDFRQREIHRMIARRIGEMRRLRDE